MRKKIFIIILTVLLLLIVWNFGLILYGFSQLRGQLKIVWNARPVQEILESPLYPDSLKDRLRFIQEVRKYAVDSLGLKESSNYTTLYDQEGKPLLMVLTASEAFSISPYRWHFPVLGSVPYKGFFDFEKGAEEQRMLKQKGYDTDYGEVSAWSTLGWFKDPILSGMLDRDDGHLAELIIHELTHATLYVKDDVDFNENLASFVGEQGAIRFLEDKFGSDSEKLLHYKHRLSDYTVFSQFMVEATKRMDSLYSAIASYDIETKKTKKDSAFSALKVELRSLPFADSSRFTGVFEKRKPNNAYLLNFVRYDAQKDSLNMIFKKKYEENFGDFIQAMKNQFGK